MKTIKPWWWYLYLPLADIKSLRDQNPQTTAFIERRYQETVKAKRPFFLQWTWVPIEEISPYFINAVINAEDFLFWQHKGILWKSLKAAMKANWRAKKMKYGASTITQQLAKNLYLSPTKNILRKIIEWGLAKKLEQHLSKKRILEIYLNVTELGPAIFGVEAAAHYWYQCSARELQPAQAARLALALPAPKSRSPETETPALASKRNQLLLWMQQQGLLTKEELGEILQSFDKGQETAPGKAPPDGPSSTAPTLRKADL